MIPGRTTSIVLVDDSDRSEWPALFLIRRGYDVTLAHPGAAMSAILRSWPDIIVLAVPDTDIESKVAASSYLRHMKVIHCHD